jgi:DNA-binding XRE family transcriptional regulator
LEAKMSPESLARSDEKLARLREEMALNELRAALAFTQEHLAKILHVRQAAISKLERRADMYVSTLADSIRAMGGELEIVAHFPQGKGEDSSIPGCAGAGRGCWRHFPRARRSTGAGCWPALNAGLPYQLRAQLCR